MCGFELADHHAAVVYHATAAIGAYNHAAMLDYSVAGGFFLSWKNAPRDEDSPGQRVLYSQSADGRAWTRTDGTNILFPNMSTNVRSGSDSVPPTRSS